MEGEGLWFGDDGLIVAYPNPYNPKKVVYLVVANSALQLHHMTKRHQPLPSWGLFSVEKNVERGYHVPEEMTIALHKQIRGEQRKQRAAAVATKPR